MPDFNDLLRLLEEAEYTVAFTGAGVSTLSGIRDFRGKDGIYKDRSVNADRLFDLGYFHEHPGYYYTHTRDMIYDLESRRPNIIHRVCARLEEQGKIRSVITQNIDLLHQRAGSRRVVEVHGSPRVHRCLECDRSFPYADICRVVQEGRVPRCDECGGVVKPEITFFGEALPMAALSQAMEEASRSDLMLVLGSTLVVQPAASIPLYTARQGGRLVIVNDAETPLDDLAALRYPDLKSCFEFLETHLP